MKSLLLQLCAVFSIHALENPIPASHLQPRNFNPHPYHREGKAFLIAPADDYQNFEAERNYEELSRRFQNTGPIRFPPNPDDPQTHQQLEQRKKVVSHIVDNQALIPHPYEKLTMKYRAQQIQRYTGNDNEVPQIFSALATHARRVQNNEFQRKNYVQIPKRLNRIDEDYQEEIDPIRSSSSNHEKKRYIFSYAVKDRNSGDDFSHTQKQENGAVHGSYKVQLPDGRLQVVKYTADDVHGYRAEVSYENSEHVSETHVPLPTPAVHYHPKPHYPKLIKQVEVNNNNIRYTVTPTPYLSQYNIRAPQVQNYYPSTTSNPRHYF